MPQEETITLAGGCFRCTEAIFTALKGVNEVVSGYTGGDVPNPTYEQICTGTTGHAEAIQVHFDPTVLSLHDLLTIFFTLHDPTTLNRQGADVGTQYRSAVFYSSEEQKKVAEGVIAEVEAKEVWPDPIVTEVTHLEEFYPAEDYHQRFFAKNASNMYCQVVINPKVSKLRKEFSDKLLG